MKVKVWILAGEVKGIIKNMCPQLYEFKITSTIAVTPCANSPALVEAVVVSCAPTSRMDMELLENFVFVQPELKWLHQPEFV